MSTYIPIQSVTITSGTSLLSFSSIPQNYTDLVLIAQTGQSSGSNFMRIRFNSSTSGYSYTAMRGNGSTTTSSRGTGESGIVTTFFDVGTNLNTVVTSYIMNYSNTNINKTVLSRAGKVSAGSSAIVGLWPNNNAITQIDIDMPNIATGSTFTLYGTAAGTAKAIGGEVTVSGGYAYHTFRQSGVFTPLENLTVDYLVVAGGGGTITTANQYYAGGGGGGGLRSSVSPTGGGGSAEAQFSATANTDYPVIVGAGAPAMPSGRFGIQGNSSSFATISCTGGGYGTTGPGQTSAAGGPGGSGGGAGSNNGSPFTVYGGGSNVSGQGYPGGQNEASDAYAAGAGGGAGGAGGSGSGGKGGTGGAAVLNSISGTATYYAGGGWGGRGFYGSATKGDNGTGYNQNPNTGMGGNATTASGQSGIVIVRYVI